MKMEWHTYAGGTSALPGKYSYGARGPWGQYTISPPSRRGQGYSLKWANTNSMTPPATWSGAGRTHTGHAGLWHWLGENYRSPQAAKSAAARHVASLRPGPFTRSPGGLMLPSRAGDRRRSSRRR